MVIEPRDIAWVIKSSDRSRVGKKNYLQATMANLRRSSPGWAHVPVTIVINDDLTLQQNAREAIQLGVMTGLPYVVVLEDDLDFCDDFQGSVARWLGDHVSNDALLYAFGASYAQIETAVAQGRTAWRYPVSAFYGAQALGWSRDAAADLVEFLGPDPSYNGVRGHGHDLLIQSWAKGHGATHFLASAPSFVEHVGVESGIGNQYFRFKSWPGREWRYDDRRRR